MQVNRSCRTIGSLAVPFAVAALTLSAGFVQASARPGASSVIVKKAPASKPAPASDPAATTDDTSAASRPATRVVDPTELPPPPRREATDDEGWTIVQVPNGFYRYQREAGETPDKEAGTVTLTPRSPLAQATPSSDREESNERELRKLRREVEKARRAPGPNPCRAERALLAQRILALRGMTDVDLDTADLLMTELEGGPSWVATAVLGTGYMPRHPAFPWQPAVIVDGQALVPVNAMSNVPNGATSVTGADAMVRWRLEDLARCQARDRRDRELAR